MSYPAKFDINIFIGLDFSLSMYMKNSDDTNVDLTGCQIEAHFRYHIPESEFVPFTGIVNIVNAKISIEMNHTLTSTMKAEIGEYDVVLIDSTGFRKLLLKGQAKVILPVTRF